MKSSVLIALVAFVLVSCDASDRKDELLRQQSAVCKDLITFYQHELESCANDMQNPSCRVINQKRDFCQAAYGDKYLTANTDILVALAYEQSYFAGLPEMHHMIDGIYFARDVINATGGISGRQIRLEEFVQKEPLPYLKYFDIFHESFSEQISENVDSIAVIGHYASIQAAKAVITYEHQGMVYIAPWSGHSGLTRHGFLNVFSTMPNNEFQVKSTVEHLVRHNLNRIAIFYDISNSGYQELEFNLVNEGIKAGLRFVLTKSFRPGQTGYRDVVVNLLGKDVDAVVIYGNPDEAMLLVKSLFEFGIRKPLISSKNMAEAAKYLSKALGESDINLVFPGLEWSRQGGGPSTQQLREYKSMRGTELHHFKNVYGYEPDFLAARGFDNLMLLVSAIETKKSTVPSVIAATLRYMLEPWQGETGEYKFDMNGKLISQQYKMQSAVSESK
ncbi:MAG: amino acid ABC transporter substrate-binding protein [Methylococcaceae bacterium]|nr:MAG: amino acid ABC transporter substrate-binding protein [Methylococcaceae bacterium]